MITLKTLKWSYAFSYGKDNSISFDSTPLTQIVGLNGHGKSSIALILEEVLYNKNSKGIKKADILNRNTDSKSYSIELDFDKDGDYYVIKTTRGNTQSVSLSKNNIDISGHTATATYKLIEEIIGYDHKTFAQIVYQSSAVSLEFLTATDTARKKFLIDLLNLTKYVDIAEVFKQAAKDLDTKVTVVSTKIGSANEWITKYKSSDLSSMELVEVPQSPKELAEENLRLKVSYENIAATNRKILQNNKYKELLDAIVVQVPGPKPELDTKSITVSIVEHAKVAKDCDAFIRKMGALGSVCPTCSQSIDLEKMNSMLEEYRFNKKNSSDLVLQLEQVLRSHEKDLKEYNSKLQTKLDYEEYHSLYDPEMATQLLDRDEIASKIQANRDAIAKIESEIERANLHNKKASAHNAKVDVLRSQLEEVTSSLASLKQELSEYQDKLNTLQILVKTFSPTGLVAYKIECLVKDLEELTNSYLVELSDGRFQIGFKVSSTDKLNVVITDHGKDVEMVALSGGERARVNAAALLGIRKLMQSLSNTRINLLILDETIENMDIEGKEKLVEVLLQEEYLNTFVISHGFQHPLLEKLQVVKKNNISRIENG